MSTPQPPRKPLTAYGVFLAVLAALVLLFVPPLRLVGGILLIAVFAGIGIAYAIVWGRIWWIRRKRRQAAVIRHR